MEKDKEMTEIEIIITAVIKTERVKDNDVFFLVQGNAASLGTTLLLLLIVFIPDEILTIRVFTMSYYIRYLKKIVC